MNERVLRLRVGIVVLAAALITFLLVMLFTAQRRLFRSTYSVMVRFPTAPGVAVNTPVRKSGIPIGRVSQVELLDDGGVRLTLRIDSDQGLQRREVARIGSASLVTGDANLEFIRREEIDPTFVAEFDEDRDGQLSQAELSVAAESIQDGDFLGNGQVARDPLQMLADAEGRIGGAFAAVQETSARMSKLADNLNALLSNNDDQIRRLFTKAETTLGNIDLAARDMHDLIGDPEMKEKLSQSIDSFAKMTKELETASTELRGTMGSIKKAGDRADDVLSSIEEIVRPLADRSEEIATNVVGITDKLDSFLLELNAVAEMLSRGEGTIGRLLADDDIYEKLSDTVDRFDLLTRKLEPLLADARTAMDKVARDPSILGIKGALNRRPPGAGIKTGIDFGDTRGRYPRMTAEPEPNGIWPFSR